MMRLVIIIMLLCACPCVASISIDATSTANGSSVSSLTFSHTVGAGSNTVLIVSASARNGSAGLTDVSSVTFNGTSLTKAVSKQENGDGNGASVWYLVAPATGAHNIVVTYGGICTTVGASGISLFGVDQVSPVDATSAGSSFASSSATASLTTVAANAWAIDAFSDSGTWSSWAAGQTDIFHSTSQGASYTGPLTSGSNSMTVNFTGFAQGAYTAASFKPSSAAATSVKRHRGTTY